MCRSGCGWGIGSSVCGRLRWPGRWRGIGLGVGAGVCVGAGVAAALTVAVVWGMGGWVKWVGQPA